MATKKKVNVRGLGAGKRRVVKRKVEGLGAGKKKKVRKVVRKVEGLGGGKRAPVKRKVEGLGAGKKKKVRKVVRKVEGLGAGKKKKVRRKRKEPPIVERPVAYVATERVSLGRAKKKGNPFLPVLLLGGGIVGMMALAKRKNLKKGGTVEVPATPAPIVTPVETPKPKGSIPVELSDKQKVDAFFRRAKAAEIPPEILALATSFLGLPMGSIQFRTDNSGKEWAYVLEEHFRDPASNEPGPKGRHKGVSMFVKKEGVA